MAETCQRAAQIDCGTVELFDVETIAAQVHELLSQNQTAY